MPPSLEQFPAREGGVATSRSNKVWQPKSSAMVRLYLVPLASLKLSTANPLGYNCRSGRVNEPVSNEPVSNEPVSSW